MTCIEIIRRSSGARVGLYGIAHFYNRCMRWLSPAYFDWRIIHADDESEVYYG